MEFGKVPSDTLHDIEFSLPADAPETSRVLSQAPAGKPEVYVGCAKWGRKDWVGSIYPKGTKEADFLKHYGKHFNSIELNATFYRIPKKTQTKSWKDNVGPGFKFCPKFSDKISHLKRFNDVGKLTEIFLDGISGFEEKLGPALLMPHPGMGPKSLETLDNYLQSLPKDLKVFVELRNPKWFSDPAAFDQVSLMLERNKAGSVITDSAGRRDCVHMRLTTPTAFIRFVGNGLHPTDYTRVDQWVARIREWIAQGIHAVYFFMHQQEEIHSPALCKYAIEQLNEKCGTTLTVPEFVEGSEPVRTPGK
ncbi:MAG TPA: DUF72 domain-containing protein [Chryseosolibacter sp.]|nr:DUF72 domain-containing protein [Chryseosolibacter sp.]